MFAACNKTFIFSLYNIDHCNPRQVEIKPGETSYAIFGCSRYGPTFGYGDIHIANNAESNKHSYTYCGNTYDLPTGNYSSGWDCNFNARSIAFTPTDVEVLYETLI